MYKGTAYTIEIMANCYICKRQCYPSLIYSVNTGGEQVLDTLTTLQAPPPTMHAEVWNLHHRHSTTVRDGIQNKNPENHTAWFPGNCIVLHDISIWYIRRAELNIWYRKLCLQLQRSYVSCSSWPGLQTLQQGFWPTPPYTPSLDPSGFGAVAGQYGLSAPSKDFLLGSGLETG